MPHFSDFTRSPGKFALKKSLSGRELILNNILNDNRPLYSCLPGDLAFEWQRGWRQPRCYSKTRSLSEQLWNGLLCSRNFPEAWGLILHRETIHLIPKWRLPQMIWVELHENEASRAKRRCLQVFYRSRYAVMPQNCFVPECKKTVYVENGVKISFHTFPEERKLFMKWIVAIQEI